MMKKILFFGILLLGSSCLNSAAITINQDTITNNIRSNMDYLYETVIPLLDRIEISGNSEASQELRKRWSRVVQHLKNNKELMYSEVNRVGRETKVFLPIFVSFPLTPPYVPFGIRRFNLFSKSV